ncbi:serpin family protein [Arthrobacter sp. BE255]|uniref:serpin family protein n=1 Tax=Arthrobacter sp. BE255 TaxID=2817721 RepID=UPI002861EABF|nr:serpin family protein [Arthrobacter sp. BE255]MDR7160808.1 serpin B [Arthrobacter sp. BE255]
MFRFQRAMALGAVMGLAACAAPAPPELLTADGVERTAADRAAFPDGLAAFRDSALRLGDALLAGEEGNVIASPGSLLIALAMLRAGASGEAAAEMDAVLGLPETDRDEAMNALLASLEEYDGDPGSVDEENPPAKPLVHTANGLFVDKNVPTGQGYLDALAKHYGTGVYPVNFRDQAVTKPAIDAWVNKNTGGRIEKAPAPYDPDNTFSLLNSVYFAAAWEVPFDANDTSDAPFTTAEGGTVDVPMMHGLQEMAYAEGSGWQAVDLPYGEGFVMRLVLPAADSDGGAGALKANRLAEVARALDAADPEDVELALPTWDHKSHFDVRAILEQLGLAKTLTTTSDFDAIQPGLMITQAAQDANITVAEKGTVAAAVTQINGMATSVGPQPARSISFDRPFHYQIVHVGTGLPLFMGKVADPR